MGVVVVLGGMVAGTPLVIADVDILWWLNFLKCSVIFVIIFTFVHDVFIVLSSLNFAFLTLTHRLSLVSHELAENAGDPGFD